MFIKLMKILILCVCISNTHIDYKVYASVVHLKSTLRPIATQGSDINIGLAGRLNELNSFSTEAVVATRVYSRLTDLPFFQLKKDRFPDGEIRITMPEPDGVKDKDVLLVHDIKTDDDLVELILQIGVLRDSGVKEIACLVPESVLGSSIILDAISPFAKIYTTEDSFFTDSNQKLTDARLNPYTPVVTEMNFERKREFDYVLLTEENRLKKEVVERLGKFNKDDKVDVGAIKVNTLESGRVSVEVPSDIAGKDCLLIHSTRTHKSIVELIAILEQLKRQGAKDIHVMFFFFGYDRQEKSFPVPEYGENALSANAAKMLLTIINQYCGRIYTMNTHFIKEPRINIFRFEGVEDLEIVNLNALPYLLDYFRNHHPAKQDLQNAVIVAPDGGVADFLGIMANASGMELCVFNKVRTGVEKVSFTAPDDITKVKGRTVIIFDDVVSGGSTVIKLARLLKDEYGAGDIYFGSVHGKQSPENLKKFHSETDRNNKLLIKDIISTDTVSSETSKVSVAEIIVEFLREHQAKVRIFVEEEMGRPSIALMLPERLAGAGDIVFMVNAAEKLKQVYPNIPIKVIFHRMEDYVFLNDIKLVSGFDLKKNIQRRGRVTYINAMNNIKEANAFVGEHDLVIVYAIYQDLDRYMAVEQYFDYFGPKNYQEARYSRIVVHELGVELNPKKHNNFPIGFENDCLGLPPVAPSFDSYAKQQMRNNKDDIYREKAKILKKIPEYDILDIDKTAQSSWGFIYAHTPNSLQTYLDSLIAARKDNPDFAKKPVTLFINHSDSDQDIYDRALQIAKWNDFELLKYNNGLKVENKGNSNVTLITNTSVPRKLFGQLFTLSDDLPSLITGQDNLSNIIHVNAITQGRAFFWEVLTWQGLAAMGLKDIARDMFGPESEEYAMFAETMKTGIPAYSPHAPDRKLLADLFINHDKHRKTFHRLSMYISDKFDFVKKISPIVDHWSQTVKKKQAQQVSEDKPGIDRPSSAGISVYHKIDNSIKQAA
jgi:ribose-phosphate pyrophosphokinase